jgi:hypothetical protein
MPDRCPSGSRRRDDQESPSLVLTIRPLLAFARVTNVQHVLHSRRRDGGWPHRWYSIFGIATPWRFFLTGERQAMSADGCTST